MNPTADASNQPQVLYVEDEPTHVTLMQALFRLRPHLRLVVATDGARATLLAPTLRPSLLMFDQQLPDCLGSELLALLRVRFGWGDVPAVSVTADSHVPGSGFVEVWHKPLDLPHVLHCLDSWLPSADAAPAADNEPSDCFHPQSPDTEAAAAGPAHERANRGPPRV